MNKNDKKNTITLTLQGDKIPADKLRKSIASFYGFLDEVAAEVSGVKKPIKWIVTVRKGSAIFANSPQLMENINPAVTAKVYSMIEQGVKILEKKAVRPAAFSDKALEHLQDLASIPYGKGNGLEKISITVESKRHLLTPYVVANVDSILGVYSKAIGSIEGKLQKVSSRGGYDFIIYDSLTDKPIKCDITEDSLEEALSAFNKRVSVFGTISLDKSGSPKHIRVDEIYILAKEKIPSALEVCGILGA